MARWDKANAKGCLSWKEITHYKIRFKSDLFTTFAVLWIILDTLNQWFKKKNHGTYYGMDFSAVECIQMDTLNRECVNDPS